MHADESRTTGHEHGRVAVGDHRPPRDASSRGAFIARLPPRRPLVAFHGIIAAEVEHARILRGFAGILAAASIDGERRVSTAATPERRLREPGSAAASRASEASDGRHSRRAPFVAGRHRPCAHDRRRYPRKPAGARDRLGCGKRIRRAPGSASRPAARRSGRDAPLAASSLRRVDVARSRRVSPFVATRRIRGRARPAGADQGRADRAHGARRAARPGPREHPRACRYVPARRPPRDRSRSAFHRPLPRACRRFARLSRRRPAAIRTRRAGAAGGAIPDRPFVVFVHGTSRADKLWPDAHWRRLVGGLRDGRLSGRAAMGKRRRARPERALRRRRGQRARAAAAAPVAAEPRESSRARRARRRRRHGARASRRRARHAYRIALRRDGPDALRRRSRRSVGARSRAASAPCPRPRRSSTRPAN